MNPRLNQKPVLRESALYGLAGETVKTIDFYTEANPVAVVFLEFGRSQMKVTGAVSFPSHHGRTLLRPYD